MLEEYAILQDYKKVLVYIQDQQINNTIIHIIEEMEIIPESEELF